MGICFMVYIGLACVFIAYRKKKLPMICYEKEGKQIIFILIIANTVALLCFVTDRKEPLKTSLLRNHFGQGSRIEKWQVSISGKLEEEEITLEIGEQEYTEKEINKIFEEIKKGLPKEILGENKNRNTIRTSLSLPTKWKDKPVRIEWSSNNYEVINNKGELQGEVGKNGSVVELTAYISYKENDLTFPIEITVLPPILTHKQKWIHKIREEIKKQEKNRETKEIVLPETLDGEKINWSKTKSQNGYIVLVMGGLCAGLILALRKQNKEKERKARKEQMLIDYPNIINKFTLFLGAGMPVKKAFEKVVVDYKRDGKKEKRYAYEEMAYSLYEMKNGVSETEGYERFGTRCRVQMYLKFGTLLSQNLKKGSKGLSELLTKEVRDAFEERKTRAKRLGEEASTKLLLPMFLMLAIVLVIVVVPAFLSIQL